MQDRCRSTETYSMTVRISGKFTRKTKMADNYK